MVEAIVFYGVAAVIFGALAASMDTINVNIRGHRLPPFVARLATGIVFGILWPMTLYQLIRKPTRD